jgi:rhodanese-related sulfurtransferase
MRKPINKDQLEKVAQNSIAHLIDIRSHEEYEKQHIPGAINIPSEELATASEQFSRNDTYVCVCNHGKERCQAAAEYLHDLGFENAFYLEGGTSGWFDE